MNEQTPYQKMSTGYAGHLASRALDTVQELYLQKPYLKNLITEAAHYRDDILIAALRQHDEEATALLHGFLGGINIPKGMDPLQVNTTIHMRTGIRTIMESKKKSKALRHIGITEDELRHAYEQPVPKPTIMQTFRNLAHMTSTGIARGERNLQGMKWARKNLLFHQNATDALLVPEVSNRPNVTLQLIRTQENAPL